MEPTGPRRPPLWITGIVCASLFIAYAPISGATPRSETNDLNIKIDGVLVQAVEDCHDVLHDCTGRVFDLRLKLDNCHQSFDAREQQWLDYDRGQKRALAACDDKCGKQTPWYTWLAIGLAVSVGLFAGGVVVGVTAF